MMTEGIYQILLVEDDARLAELTRTYLARYGHEVVVASLGVQGLALARRADFHVVLLDLMLPDMDGMELCRSLRAFSDVPVIMLTARGEEADRILGLELGADDYLAKPFSPRELLARIRAVVRRHMGRVGPSRQMLVVGALRLDPSARQTWLGEEAVELTAYEFDLLYALAQHAGRPLGRERLMDLARGSGEEAFDRSVDVHVSRLRKKLGDDSQRPHIIKTVRGIGYQLVANDER